MVFHTVNFLTDANVLKFEKVITPFALISLGPDKQNLPEFLQTFEY
jgi:hypothetical protein